MFDGIDNAYPLTPLQEGILYEVLRAPDSDIYVAYVLIDINGPLDEHVFKQAWTATLSEHDTLRTRFVWEGLDEPLQLVDSAPYVQWETVDAATTASTDDALIDRWLSHERSNPLSLSERPPLRFRLIKFGTEHSKMLWTVHHLLADDWSTPIVLKSVLDKYSELAGATPLVESQQRQPLPFSDYVDWVSSTDFSASKVWWKENLRDAVPTPIAVGYQGGHCTDMNEQFHPRLKRQLDVKTAHIVADFSTQTGMTQSSLFHAAWALTLSQYAGSELPIFGTSVSGRTCPLPGIDSAVGLFLNTVPTRIQVDPDQSPVAFLSSVQSRLFDQMSHEHLPLSEIQAATQTQLFESVVVVESHGSNLNLASRNSKAIRFGEIRYETDSNYPLTLLVFPAERPEVHFLAKAEFMEQSLVVQLCDSFVTLLNNLCNSESTSIRQVLQTHQTRYVSAASTVPAALSLVRPPVKTMDEWLVHTAVNQFSDIAVRHKSENVSYGMLLQRAVSVACEIQQHSPANDCIGVYIGRSADQIVAVLAVLLSGHGYLALDVEWPAQRINQMVQAAGCSLILSQADSIEKFASPSITVLDIRNQLNQTVSDIQEVEQALASLRETATVTLDEDSLAYLMFTSGSTGTPKSVPVSHRNLVYSTTARIDYYARQPKAYLLLSSLAFDSSVAGIFWTLCTGGTLVLANEDGGNDIHEISALVVKHQISHTLCLPSLYGLLLQYAESEKLQSLDTVIVAGESCPLYLVDSHQKILPKAHLYNEYGPTEATVWASVACLHPESRSQLGINSGISIGKAIPGCGIEVRNALDEPCPAGITGEIVISSPGVVAGYRTSQKVEDVSFENPALIDKRWADSHWGELLSYRTGDLGFFDGGGHLYFIGRIDEQVKIRGYRVEPAEISWRVERQNDVLAAHCVLTSAQQLICYVVPTDFEEPGACRLIEGEGVIALMNRIALAASDCITQELPAYFAVSRYLPVSGLPRLPNGKIDKKGFPHCSPSIDARSPAEPPMINADIGSTTDTQTSLLLCQLLEEQLGTTGITANDNFFSLGGDSLSAIRFVARCREQGLELNIPMVSQFSTLQALGEALDQNASGSVANEFALPSTAAHGEIPLTPVQRWFFAQNLPRQEQWNMGFTVTLANNVDCGELTRVIEQVVGSLNVLGTRFTQNGSKWAAFVPEFVDVSDLVICVNEPINEDAWAVALADAQVRFNLASGKLLSFVLGECASNGSCRSFGVVIHHLVTDALSNQFLAGLLVRALESQTVPLAENTSYRAWAIQLSRTLSAGSNEYSQASTSLETRWLECHVVSKRWSIDQSLLTDLITHCQNTGIELHEAILFVLVCSVNTQANIQVDLEMHGRDLMADVVDVSGSIGWFTSFFRLPSCDPVAIQVTEFSELLRTARLHGQDKFLVNPECYFDAVAPTSDNQCIAKLPLLYNFLVGASTSDMRSAHGQGGATIRSLLDTRLRHPESVRSHPVDCVVLDGAAGELDVLWRIDRSVMHDLDMNAWQAEFITQLTALCRNEAGLAKSPDDDFSDSGLDDDELERLLNGL